MPKISEFYGISIYMYWGEHGVPHFHAVYGGYAASFAIETLEMLAGQMPPRAISLIREWAEMHKKELMENWERAKKHQELKKIPPLE